MGAFNSYRAAALALLTSPEARLTRNAGAFLGQLVADTAPLTQKQREWLDTLLERAGMPSFVEGGEHG